MSFKEVIPFVAIAVSFAALIFSVRNFWRKSGIQVKGQFCISSGFYIADKYVASITLENFKDRSVIIFKIFLRIGSNYYVELDDFENDPKILKPYECFTINYGPVDFYSVNMNRVRLNSLLDAKNVKSNIVLSTSQGKYVVKKWINRWDPILDFFKNHLTAIVIPMRPQQGIQCYGSGFKYLVTLRTEDGYKNTIPIYASDEKFPRFEKFRLTKESLASCDSLENYLLGQAVIGNLQCIDIEVIDAEKYKKDNYGDRYEKSFDAEYYSWFYYHVFGKLLTIGSNIRLHIINRRQRKASKASHQSK